jgi:hypothetical protein
MSWKKMLVWASFFCLEEAVDGQNFVAIIDSMTYAVILRKVNEKPPYHRRF